MIAIVSNDLGNDLRWRSSWKSYCAFLTLSARNVAHRRRRRRRRCNRAYVVVFGSVWCIEVL